MVEVLETMHCILVRLLKVMENINRKTMLPFEIKRVPGLQFCHTSSNTDGAFSHLQLGWTLSDPLSLSLCETVCCRLQGKLDTYI